MGAQVEQLPPELKVPAQPTPTPNPNPNPNPTPTPTPTLTLTLALARTRWLLTHNTSPMTGAALPHKHLVPAISLRQLIVEFRGVGPDD